MTTNSTPPPDPRDAIIAQLRRENRYLRSKVGDPPLGLQRVNTIGRILRRAYDDALSLLALRDANYTVTRALAVSLGISERRYYWAIGLLRSASVMRKSQWLITAYEPGALKLEKRYDELRERADALDLLRLYMPQKMEYNYQVRSGKQTRAPPPARHVLPMPARLAGDKLSLHATRQCHTLVSQTISS